MFDSFCCQVDKKQWYQEMWAVQVYICYAVQGELIYNSDCHWDFMMHPPGKFNFSDKGRFQNKFLQGVRPGGGGDSSVLDMVQGVEGARQSGSGGQWFTVSSELTHSHLWHVETQVYRGIISDGLSSPSWNVPVWSWFSDNRRLWFIEGRGR